jgi:RNA polymerase sigma-70 factor (ECF subfamily)
VAQDAAEGERLEEERRLVERAQAGDRNALRPIFERYANPLYAGVILPRLGDKATAEDVLKDTFVTAIEKIDQFSWQGRSVYVWLRQIAVNKVIDVHRRSSRTGRFLQALAEELPLEATPELGADEALIAEQERQRSKTRISAALEEILPRYRQAIELRLIEELGRDECARRMGVTVGHFDVLLFRAIRAFRRVFGDPTTAGDGEGRST